MLTSIFLVVAQSNTAYDMIYGLLSLLYMYASMSNV